MEYQVIVQIFGTLFIAFLYFPLVTCESSCLYDKNVNCTMAENVIDFVRFNFEKFLDYSSIVSYDLHDKKVHKIVHDLAKLMKEIRLEEEDKSFYVSICDLRHAKENITAEHMLGNTIALVSSDKLFNWPKMFTWMMNTRVNTGILVVAGKLNDSKVNHLRNVVNDMPFNAMFYQTHINEDEMELPTWNQVISLQGYENGILNRIKFNAFGRIKENFNMHGMNIIGLALTWEPYFSMQNCTDMSLLCKKRSYLAETLDIMGEMVNFTWKALPPEDGSWGTKPISGPANSSGVWGGMIGDVFYGNYQLAIRYK